MVKDLTPGNAFEGDFYWFDEALVVEFHLVDANDAVVAVVITERTPAVNNVASVVS